MNNAQIFQRPSRKQELRSACGISVFEIMDKIFNDLPNDTDMTVSQVLQLVEKHLKLKAFL